MRLYYFTSEQFGLEAIRDKRLKIAIVNELNDPFEFLGLDLNREDRRSLLKWKNELSKRKGLICMSGNWWQPLLWGHYADKHRGLCLGFDVNDSSFRKVAYQPNRLTLQEFGLNSLSEMTEKHMEKLLFTKFVAWKYEEEYRGSCDLGSGPIK